MQRRTPSRSIDVSSNGAPSEANDGKPRQLTKASSETHRKTRRRLIYIVGPIGALFLLLHFLTPSRDGFSAGSLPGFGSRSSLSRRTDRHLQAVRDRRRTTAAANFSELPPYTFCPTGGERDELANLYGTDALLKTRHHTGSPERIHNVLRRAMAGLPITISVLGGSISSCHGLDATQAHPLGNPIGPNCYPHRLFAWLNDVFPHPANELTNGAWTSYFGYCSEQHLPDRIDLVVLDFDTEDPNDPTTLENTDLLVRSLLLRADAPAIIMLGHFAPQMQGEYGFAGPELYHSAVAHFYDVPYLSVKGLLYEEYLLNPTKVRQSYYIDPILANYKGHELLADTLIAFLEAEICQVWDAAALEADLAGLPLPEVGNGLGLGIDTDEANLRAANIPSSGKDAPYALLGGKGLRKSGDAGLDAEDAGTSQTGGKGAKSQRNAYRSLPPFRILDRPHTVQHFREIKPSCASANDLVNPLPASLFSGTGWTPVVPKPDDEDDRHYWYSDVPGSLLKIPVKVGAGDIAVYFLRGPISAGWGSVLCWVDDNTAGAVELEGYWDRDYGQPVVQKIDQNVGRGQHYVECELQGDPESTEQTRFAIYGIFST